MARWSVDLIGKRLHRLGTVVAANENYIASLFSYNVAKIALARAMGSAETRLSALFGAQ